MADQAAQAQQAISLTLQELQHSLAQGADVRSCAKKHPWIATGSAIAAGFVAGAALTNRRSATGEKLPFPTDAGPRPEATPPEPFPQKPGFVRSAVGNALTGIAQTLLQSFIAAAVVATEADPLVEEPRRHGSAPPVVPREAVNRSNHVPLG